MSIKSMLSRAGIVFAIVAVVALVGCNGDDNPGSGGGGGGGGGGSPTVPTVYRDSRLVCDNNEAWMSTVLTAMGMALRSNGDWCTTQNASIDGSTAHFSCYANEWHTVGNAIMYRDSYHRDYSISGDILTLINKEDSTSRGTMWKKTRFRTVTEN